MNEEYQLAPHRGVIILILGIVSLITCGLLGIFAWIMGSDDLREMDAGRMDPSGRDLTLAGKICGIIATILLLIPLVIVFLVMVFMGLMTALH